MGKPVSRRQGAGDIDTDQDRYPTLTQVLRKIVEDEEIPDGNVERIEVTCLADGSATCRVWTARAEEPVGRYFPPPTQGSN